LKRSDDDGFWGESPACSATKRIAGAPERVGYQLLVMSLGGDAAIEARLADGRAEAWDAQSAWRAHVVRLADDLISIAQQGDQDNSEQAAYAGAKDRAFGWPVT
jgi:hypothetical protein